MLAPALRSEIPLGDFTRNIGSMFLRNREKFADKPAFAQRERGQYCYRTWLKFVNDVLAFSIFLSRKGFRRGDRVAFISSNSYDRLVCEMAVMSGGLVSVPIFQGYPDEVMRDLLRFSEPKLVITDQSRDFEQEVYSLTRAELPKFDPTDFGSIRAVWLATEAHDLALVMFTSGTSSFPKGVELTHANLMSQQKALELLWPVESGMRFLCYLPWHHSFGGLFERFFALHSGGCLAIDDSWGKDTDLLFRNFDEIKPHVYFSVPKIYQEIVARTLSKPECDAIFFNEHLKFIFTAAAPLPISISNVFKNKGIPVVEGWGLTETSPCCTLTPATQERQLGVVGIPIPGVEIMLGDENEILVRGPNVMRGYFKNPHATRDVLDKDGWFATGDIGEITPAGVKILSRKDRMFKLSNGEKVFPAVLEETIKARCKFIKHAYVFGKGQPNPCALLFPNYELFAATTKDADCEFPQDASSLCGCLHKCLQKINDETAARFEKISCGALIEAELTLEKGELTPSFKLVPRKVEENYGTCISALTANTLNELPREARAIKINAKTGDNRP